MRARCGSTCHEELSAASTRRSPTSTVSRSPPRHVDDLHWIPPVARELTESRDELVARVRGAGAPVLVQVAAGDALPVEADVLLVDPLAWLVRPGREVAIEVPADAWLLWPILAGLSEDLDAFDEICRSLRRQGVRGVLPIAMRISSVERRLLARGRDDLFEALFHGVVPAERRFAERAKSAWPGGLARAPARRLAAGPAPARSCRTARRDRRTRQPPESFEPSDEPQRSVLSRRA